MFIFYYYLIYFILQYDSGCRGEYFWKMRFFYEVLNNYFKKKKNSDIIFDFIIEYIIEVYL